MPFLRHSLPKSSCKPVPFVLQWKSEQERKARRSIPLPAPDLSRHSTSFKGEANMYQLSVPVMNATVHKGTREEYLRQFRAAGVRRVFLVPDTDMVTGTVRSFDLLKENIAYFSANGLLVGIWVARAQTSTFASSPMRRPPRISVETERTPTLSPPKRWQRSCPPSWRVF